MSLCGCRHHLKTLKIRSPRTYGRRKKAFGQSHRVYLDLKRIKYLLEHEQYTLDRIAALFNASDRWISKVIKRHNMMPAHCPVTETNAPQHMPFNIGILTDDTDEILDF